MTLHARCGALSFNFGYFTPKDKTDMQITQILPWATNLNSNITLFYKHSIISQINHVAFPKNPPCLVLATGRKKFKNYRSVDIIK